MRRAAARSALFGLGGKVMISCGGGGSRRLTANTERCDTQTQRLFPFRVSAVWCGCFVKLRRSDDGVMVKNDVTCSTRFGWSGREEVEGGGDLTKRAAYEHDDDDDDGDDALSNRRCVRCVCGEPSPTRPIEVAHTRTRVTFASERRALRSPASSPDGGTQSDCTRNTFNYSLLYTSQVYIAYTLARLCALCVAGCGGLMCMRCVRFNETFAYGKQVLHRTKKKKELKQEPPARQREARVQTRRLTLLTQKPHASVTCVLGI